MSFTEFLNLIPTDFATIFVDKKAVEHKHPWRYIDDGRYELRQLLYYSDSSWRMFTTTFTFSGGFSFSAQLLSGQGTLNTDAKEICREEFDSLFAVKNGSMTLESYADNDPQLIQWFIDRNIITSVSKNSFASIKNTLELLWNQWGRTIYDIQDNEFLLASNHLFYDYMQPIQSNITMYPKEEGEWDELGLKETWESKVKFYVPNTKEGSGWYYVHKGLMRSSLYQFEIDDRKLLCNAEFDFQSEPKYKITHVTYTDVSPWETFCITKEHKDIILNKMKSDGLIRAASSFSRRSWEDRSIKNAHINVRSEPFIQNLIDHSPNLSDKLIKRW